MSSFKYADWNPTRGTVPAYFVDERGQIEKGEIVIVDAEPANNYGESLTNDGKQERLVGWAHNLCQSFENGRVLVPLKGH